MPGTAGQTREPAGSGGRPAGPGPSCPVDRFPDILLGEASPFVRWRVAIHLRGCASCRVEWDRLSGAVAVPGGLGTFSGSGGADEVVDQVRADLLARVARDGVRRRLWQRTRFGFGVVSGALALLVVMRVAGAGRVQSVAQLGAEPVSGWRPTKIASLAASGTPAKGVVYLDASARRVTLEVWGLPSLPADDVYEVWWVTETGREPAGTFAVDRRGDAVSTVHLPAGAVHVRAVGITREPLPGTPTPTTSKVIGGRVKAGSFRGIGRGAAKGTGRTGS